MPRLVHPRRLATAALAAVVATGLVATVGLTVNASAASAADTCAQKSRPAGKVLQGYWESWDSATNGVHPGLGYIPIDDARSSAARLQRAEGGVPGDPPRRHGDVGTTGWTPRVDVPTPGADVRTRRPQGTTILHVHRRRERQHRPQSRRRSRTGSSRPSCPSSRPNNFDGIDIDIEAGLTGSAAASARCRRRRPTSIRIIDGVLAEMPAGFGLTMAPETAYVTGGSVVYGSIWGSYLPIIKKYADNGRLWWLNMQYYNGSMYGCAGNSYAAGTVAGLRRRRPGASNNGPDRPGHDDPGAVRQAGARPAGAARRGRRVHVARARGAALDASAAASRA